MTAMHQRNMRRGRMTSPMSEPSCWTGHPLLSLLPVPEERRETGRREGTRSSERLMINSPERPQDVAAVQSECYVAFTWHRMKRAVLKCSADSVIAAFKGPKDALHFTHKQQKEVIMIIYLGKCRQVIPSSRLCKYIHDVHLQNPKHAPRCIWRVRAIWSNVKLGLNNDGLQ